MIKKTDMQSGTSDMQADTFSGYVTLHRKIKPSMNITKS